MKEYILIVFIALTQLVSAQDPKLTGTIIGTEASVDYSTGSVSSTINGRACAMDGDLETFFASYDRSKTWVGLDLGTPHVITRVGWAPRNDSSLGSKRVQLGIFEGANDPDFLDAVPLYVNTELSPLGEISYADVNVSRGFRYVRYIGPNDARCNIAEVEFYGHEGEGDDSQFYQVTNLPTITIHTQNNVDPYDKVNEITSHFTLIYDGGTRIQEKTGTSRLRGNTSMGFDKKPYRIKFDEQVRVLKGSTLESPAKAKKWTLVNPWDDKTLMRNIVGFEVARRVGMEYAPYCQAVDLILNGEFKGCYQLTDQVTIDKNRVNITEMEPTDNEEPAVTGGYLIEMDALAGGETSKFTSENGIPVTIKSPDSDAITSQQSEYIEGYFNLMENAVYSDAYTDSVTGYRKYVNLDSFLKHFLTSEFTANSDMYWSTYAYKDREDDQFKIGPVWDLNLAFDNDGRSYPNSGASDWTYRYVVSYAGTIKNWVDRILSDPYAEEQLRNLWNDVRSERMTSESLVAYVDSMEDYLQQSQELNFMRWDVMNKSLFSNPQIAGSYEGEVEVMRNFIKNRFVWIDDKLEFGDPYGRRQTYEIANADDLEKFAEVVNSEGMKAAGAVLTADIDLTGRNVVIGTESNHYQGTFDGAGHTITVDINRTSNDAALFQCLGGTVKNLEVKGTIHTSAKYASGIAAHTYGATIQQCASLVDIVSTIGGDGTHGGLVGVSETGATVENCVFAGSMTGSKTNSCGGIVGWASGSTRISNCVMVADLQVSESNCHTLCRNYSNVTSTGNYYLNALNEVGDATHVTQEELANGSLCYTLNEGKTESPKWYQNLDNGQTVDGYPTPISSHGIVYPGPDGYTNAESVSAYTLVDGKGLTIPAAFKVKEFHYTRKFTSGNLQALYIPAEVPVSAFRDQGLEVYYINNVTIDGDEQRLEMFPLKTGMVEANTPYAVKATISGSKDIVAQDVQIFPATEHSIDCHSMTQEYVMTGSYKTLKTSELPGSGYYVLSGGKLTPIAKASTYLTPERWYLKCTSRDEVQGIAQKAPQVMDADVVQIASGAELADFAQRVNNGENSLNARLSQDIDYTKYSRAIGASSAYNGTFDGAGHTITIKQKHSLFGYLGGTIQDLTVQGTITTADKFAAGFAAHVYGGTIKRCTSLVNIVSTVNGDGTHAGIAAVTDGGGSISDCLFAGSMSGKSTNCCGGIVGWATTTTIIENCLQIATMNVSTSGSHTICRNYGNVIASNNLYLNSLGDVGDEKRISNEQLQSGEVCYMLNRGNTDSPVWYQTIGMDEYPVLDDTHDVVTLKDGNYQNPPVEYDSYTLADGTDINSMRSTKVDEFHYQRTFDDTEYEPLYLPVSLPQSAFSEAGIKVYSLNTVNLYDRDGDEVPDEHSLEIEEVTEGSLQANYPYLVKASEVGLKDIVTQNVTIQPAKAVSADCASVNWKYTVVGNHQKGNVQQMYQVADGKLKLTPGWEILPQRWYVQVGNRKQADAEAPAEIMISANGDEPSGLDTLLPNSLSNTNESLYDLQGRKMLCEPKSGVFIRNGKKLLEK